MGARFWWLIAATFLGFLGMGTVLPGMAPHIRRDLGGTDETVGLVIGTFSLVALGSRFISGPLADRKGRKAAFLTGLFSCGLAGCAYLLPIGIQGAYLGRALQGFGEACLYTGAAAWVVEAAGIDRSARALGFLSSGIWGGIAAGPVVGSWLVSFEHAAMLQVMMALAAFLILWRIPEDYTPHPDPGKRVWLPGHLIKPGLAVGFVSVHYPVVAGFLILHLANHGNSGPMAFSAYAGFMLLARFFFGGLPDRVAPQRTYYVGIAAMAIGLAGLASGPAPVLAVVSSAMLGLGFSFPWSSVLSTVLKRTPSHERGSVVGVMSAFYDLFVGVSSFAAGVLANHMGYSATFLMALGALVAAAVAGHAVFASEYFEPVPLEAEVEASAETNQDVHK
jgi:MFS family permease